MFNKIIIFLALFPASAIAQNTVNISYRQAIALALENNYDIQIAKNNAQQSLLQNTLGNAGMLPKLDINANGNLASNNTNQKFSNGLEVNQNGVQSNTLNAGAYLSWTIFDGLKMFATRERLKLLSHQSSLSFKIQIENTIEEVTLLYYQIVRQEQLIKGAKAAMDVSDQRIKIAEKKKTLGSGSNVELLQAKLDLNAQRSNLVTQKYLLNEFKNRLLVVTKSQMGTDFSVDTFFSFEGMQSKEELVARVDRFNSSILFAQQNALLSRQNIKELTSQKFPTVGLNTNYIFGRSQNAAGFALLNQNLGLNTGFVFSWNLFDGLKTSNQIRVAKIQQLNAGLELERNRLNQFANTQAAYTRWLGDKEILLLEEENIKLAEESLQIATERMKLGLGNYLETKESQSSYEAAITRLVNARYNLKQSETTLKKLCGDFLKQN